MSWPYPPSALRPPGAPVARPWVYGGARVSPGKPAETEFIATVARFDRRLSCRSPWQEESMKTRYTVALSLLAGVAVGAPPGQSLHGPTKPPAHVRAEIDVTNPGPYDKEYVPGAIKAITDGGGKYIVRGG